MDLPNVSRYGQPGNTIPLVCLTDAGRAHVATHAADYERIYQRYRSSPRRCDMSDEPLDNEMSNGNDNETTSLSHVRIRR